MEEELFNKAFDDEVKAFNLRQINSQFTSIPINTFTDGFNRGWDNGYKTCEEQHKDAIEFSKWCQVNDWFYFENIDKWVEGKWLDADIKTIPTYKDKQLFELWQQSRK